MRATWVDWLTAARLRTLPLACAATWCGAWVAQQQQALQTSVWFFSTATAMALQVFSNLANDYGDAMHGADRYRTHAPQRMVATGKICAESMRLALWLNGLLCCVLGVMLLWVAAIQAWGVWLLLGASALLAAFTYTAGAKPYGYWGWGDLAVWVFFGGLGVAGSATLHSGEFQAHTLLPASALGCWCVMVLNLNNMRDCHSDQQAGKRTLAVRLGIACAKHYHAGLASMAWGAWLWFLLPLNMDSAAWLLLVMLLSVWHIRAVYHTKQAAAFDRLLPQWSISVLLLVALLWLC